MRLLIVLFCLSMPGIGELDGGIATVAVRRSCQSEPRMSTGRPNQNHHRLYLKA